MVSELKGKVEVICSTPVAEAVIELAGRECHQSETDAETRGEFIKRLIKMGHTSVLEHASITFRLSEMSRACSHQLVRHRIASYSQRSQRFTKTKEGENFVVPQSIVENPFALAILERSYSASIMAYNQLIELGIKQEDARYVLPAGATTSIVVTMNFRSLRNFFEQRLSKKAQREIRMFAEEMLSCVMKIAPSVFDDIWKEYYKETGAAWMNQTAG